MKGIFGDWFDLNGDGKVDVVEGALELMLLAEILEEDEQEHDAEDDLFDGEE